MVVNQGAYPITVFPPTIILNLVRVLFPDAYRIDNYSFDGTVVASNTGTYIAFRGPWESETWARERISTHRRARSAWSRPTCARAT